MRTEEAVDDEHPTQRRKRHRARSREEAARALAAGLVDAMSRGSSTRPPSSFPTTGDGSEEGSRNKASGDIKVKRGKNRRNCDGQEEGNRNKSGGDVKGRTGINQEEGNRNKLA